MIAGLIAGVLAIGLGILAAAGASALSFSLFGIAWLLWAILSFAINSAQDRAKLQTLAQRTAVPYTATVDWLLTHLPNWLMPKAVTERPYPARGWRKKLAWLTTLMAKDAEDKTRLAQNPWGWPVFDLALKLAILYPLLFGAAQWALWGGAAGLGDVPLFPDDIPQWIRITAFCGVAMLIASRILASATSKTVYAKLATWLFLSLWSAVAFAGVGAGAFAGVIAFADAGAFASAVAVAFAVVVAFAGTGVLTLAHAVAGASAITGAGLLLILLCWATRRAQGTLGYLLFWAILTASTAAAAIVLPPVGTDDAIYIVGLALLPLINALFDWLSYGITFWLLRAGRNRGGLTPLLCGLADIIAALALFFAVSLTLCTVLAIIDLARPAPLTGVGALLAGVRDAPIENLWVIAMVASTLLPTLIHFGIGILSIVTWFPAKYWEALINRLNPGTSAVMPPLASLALTASLTAYFMLPLLALGYAGHLIWTYGAPLRIAYVDTLASILTSMGLL